LTFVQELPNPSNKPPLCLLKIEKKAKPMTMEEKPAVVYGDTFLSGDDGVMDVRRRGRKHKFLCFVVDSDGQQ
jgi:hypothetical protein